MPKTPLDPVARAVKDSKYAIQWAVIGLIGLALAKLPMLGIIGFVCAALGVTTGVKARRFLVQHNMAKDASRATVGIVLGAMGLAVGVVVLVAVVYVLMHNLG